MRDIRKEIRDLLTNWGHDVLLQRRITPHEKIEVDYSTTLERHTVRHTYPANRGLPEIAEESLVGIAHDVEMIYYFMHDANPSEGDRIYENVPSLPSDQTTYLVDYALPMRGKQGRIEFWTVGASRESPN